MLSRSQRPLTRLQTPSTAPKPNGAFTPSLFPVLRDNRTRNRNQLRRINRMTKVHKRIAILRIRTPLLRQRKHNPVHRGLEQPIRPVTQQVPDIHQDGREWVSVSLVAGDNGHRRPGLLRRQDLQPRLSGSLEEQRDAAVVGVGAGAHVFVVLVGCCCRRED